MFLPAKRVQLLGRLAREFEERVRDRDPFAYQAGLDLTRALQEDLATLSGRATAEGQ